MFVLKKILTAFLIPPGIFIPILLLIAWRLRSRRLNGYAAAVCGVALLVWAASIAPTSRALLAGLEKGYGIPEHPHGDVIILLGGGTHDQVPDLSGRGILTGDSLQRVVTAARLQKRLGIPVIISGGSVFAGRTPEAVISRRFLIDLGVPADRIITEERSRDTVENALYSRKILEHLGFRKPLLITSAYHMRRSVAAFQGRGVEVTPVPSYFMASGKSGMTWFDWLPGAGFLGETSSAIKEQLGSFIYRLTIPEAT